MDSKSMQIKINHQVKSDADQLFNSLGMDMSTAINIFLRQCLIHGGLPFNVEIPKYSYRKDTFNKTE